MKKKTGIFFNCIICKTECYVPLYRSKIAKTCSRKCASTLSKRQFKKNCEICKKEFSFTAARIDKAKYCSNPCYYKAQHIKKTIEITCSYCSKIFRSSKKLNRKYCSMGCMGMDRRNEIPSSTLVRKTFLKLNRLNKCEECGWNKDKRVLGIHHKDHNNKNNLITNLIVLCANCHSLHHKKHIVHGGFKDAT